MIQAKPAFGKRLSGYEARTVPPALAITVLYTAVRPTLCALRHAASLARDLGAAIRILNVRAVPYPLPLDKPPADREVLARKAQISFPINWPSIPPAIYTSPIRETTASGDSPQLRHTS